MASPLERTLRIITLISFPFTIALLIPATVESTNRNAWHPWHHNSVIGFCFIPLGFTVATSVAYLLRERVLKRKAASSLSFSQPASHPHLWALADFMIFSGYVVALVMEWVQGIDRLGWDTNIAFLEAYATVPIMLNM
jgi:hypothetical protein